MKQKTTQNSCCFKVTNGKKKLIFSDSIYNTVPEIRFDDFNNDNIKDILVQHTSDVRSNRTYYLYLVDLVQDKLTKINDFEEIKKPNNVSEYDFFDR